MVNQAVVFSTLLSILTMDLTEYPENINGQFPNKVVTIHRCKGKGKAIPLKALTGPEVSSRLRLPDFKTIGI
jgi:hypothetical protein